MRTFYLSSSRRTDKKFDVKLPDDKIISFGARGYEDYTIHKDSARKRRYIQRHRNGEIWTISGIETAGFWSRWILWNKPTLGESVRATERRFGIKIVIC